uniref:Cyclin N-terminal domain-containing protein n=1 Tax=Hemiselmis andersenii TaxID=464988 RepID=A0A7S1ECA1_HEMAN|mmetsp:Transcript_44299/g.108114  ORF Transcript_44299/g.108114 Transcript_44299/m.108114 type:complete len:479 (+) Transcript_44299:239-1675(+)
MTGSGSAQGGEEERLAMDPVVQQPQPLGAVKGQVVGHKRKPLSDINPNTSDRQLRPKPSTGKAVAGSKAGGSSSACSSRSTQACSQGSECSNATTSTTSTAATCARSAVDPIAESQETEATVTEDAASKADASDNPPSDAPAKSEGKEEEMHDLVISLHPPTPPAVYPEREVLIHSRVKEGGSCRPLSPTPDGCDIDGEDGGDEFAVSEYTGEIYTFLRRRERASMVRPDYMSRQDDINHKMRVILTDWLVEVHLKFRLRHETLFLCFQLMDRFLQDNIVVRNRLQLVGVTAMMLASKYEEIYPPEMRDFVYICDNAYTRTQILEMEQMMLEKLRFRLSLPTPWSFMSRFCKSAGKEGDKAFLHLVSYVAELSQIEYGMLKHAPSMLVASSIAIANMMLKEKECWGKAMQHHTKYSLSDLTSCIKDCLTLVRQAHSTANEASPKFKAVHKKFTHASYSEVTSLPHEHVSDVFVDLMAA